MSDDLVEILRRIGSRDRGLGPGEFLFRRDDKVRSLFLVNAGEVHLVRFNADGDRLIVQRAVAGQVIAEASVFSEVYHCDAIALTPSTLVEISRKRFRAELLVDEQLANEWNRYLAREVQTARMRAEVLSLKKVASRIDAWLNLHSGDLPEKGAWKTFAAQIGVTPEALYRELAKRTGRYRAREE